MFVAYIDAVRVHSTTVKYPVYVNYALHSQSNQTKTLLIIILNFKCLLMTIIAELLLLSSVIYDMLHNWCL